MPDYPRYDYGEYDGPQDYPRYNAYAVEPENVEPGTHRGRMRIIDPGPAGDPSVIDPMERGGPYDKKLFPETVPPQRT